MNAVVPLQPAAGGTTGQLEPTPELLDELDHKSQELEERHASRYLALGRGEVCSTFHDGYGLWSRRHGADSYAG